MKAMMLKKTSLFSENPSPLVMADCPDPVPEDHEILVHIGACGVCHTEIDIIEGRTPPSSFPRIPGHQIVGKIEKTGRSIRKWKPGDRVGIGWIFSACGRCRFCQEGNENLCADFRATGRDHDGGYAEAMTVPEGFAVRIPDLFSDVQAAPLLCAGAIGYRSLRLSLLKDGECLGLFGFGASAHLVMKMTKHLFPDSPMYVFARSETERRFAAELGAVWTGVSGEEPPRKLRSVIDTTPVWKPVLDALKVLEPGGRLVVNAIRKEDSDRDQWLRIDYPSHLWMEKEIKSVANVARRDLEEFLALAADIPILPDVEVYGLEQANQALLELKAGRIRGAKVLKMG